MNQELQDKAAFFAQYWKQNVFTYTVMNGSPRTCSLTVYEMDRVGYYKTCYLSLKPLSAITDEDAIEVANIMDIEPVLLTRDEFHLRFGKEGDCIGIWFDGEILVDGEQCPLCVLQAYDHLRSRRYLLPFRQYTTQQLLDMGWAKLKTKP